MSLLGRALEPADLPAAAEAWLDAAKAGDEDAVVALARILGAVRARAEAGDPGAAWVASAFTDDEAEAERLRAVAVAGRHGRALLWAAERLDRDREPERWLDLVGAAAEGGCAEAQHALALACATGAGVERDPALAAAWFREAAAWGRPESLHGLGAALLEVGDPADRDEAVDALRRAALAGDAPSMFLYASQVIEADKIEALRWLIDAADSGHADALVVAKRLAATLEPADVRAADRRTQTDGSVAEGLLAGP